MPKVPVVHIGKDGDIGIVMGDHDPAISAVHVKEQVYLPQSGDWGKVNHKTWRGTQKTKGLVVREGHPLCVPLFSDQEPKWPNSAALEAYYKANMAEGLSRRSRGMAPRGDLMKSLLGLPRPVLIGIVAVVAILIYIAISPDYISRVFGG